MSTEDERVARKELEIEKLRAQVEGARNALYIQLDHDAETDEQKELVRQYKTLDQKIEKLDRKYWETNERLCAEREQVFEEITA